MNATGAPLLTPVATSNGGRVPLAVHPFSTPAVNAAYFPPPDTHRTFCGRSAGVTAAPRITAASPATASVSASW
jgi:hypothetical protein